MTLTLQDWLSFLRCGSLIRLEDDLYIIGWGKRTWFENYFSSPTPFFFFPDFFLSSPNVWFQHEKIAFVTCQELLDNLPNQVKKRDLKWSHPFKEHFESTLLDLKNLFSQGLLKKVVPYTFEEAEDDFNPARLSTSLRHLLEYTKDQFLHVYGFWGDKEGMLGASPEILFEYSEKTPQKVKTIACAGTKRSELRESLLDDPKEMFEHQLVIEGLMEALAPLGSVEVGKTQLLHLPTLSHVITPVEVEMDDPTDFLTLVKALHPTPALGAFPKIPGEEWLKSYERKVPRQRYGAPIGYLNVQKSTAKCIVGIRNIQWDTEKLMIGAGCGLVEKSLKQNEWQEIYLKIASIKEMMSL